MDGVLQRVVSILIAVVILFILPVYVAYEKRDDISYALALNMTTDFVNNVNSKGYITNEMYTDFLNELAVTQNSYDVYMEHVSKKYNPVIYSYSDDLKTIRAKFDYNLYKTEFEAGQIEIAEGANAGTYNNLVLAYDLAEKKYTEKQILDVISSTNKPIVQDMNLEAYKNVDIRSLPAVTSMYKLKNDTYNIYTLNEGDEFSVIIKNRNTTMASTIYNMITFGASAKNTTKVYVNYGGTVKAELYRDKEIIDETPKAPTKGAETESNLLASYNTNGLVMLLEGETNNGNSHSNTTDIWKDYTENGNNALLSNFNLEEDNDTGWIFNGLRFNGTQYASIEDIDPEELTIEVVCKFDSITDIDTPEQTILSNMNNGGVSLVYKQLNSTDVANRGKMVFNITNADGSITPVTLDEEVIQANKIYSISGSIGKMQLEQAEGDMFAYETSAQLISINGKANGIPFNSTLKKPAEGSKFVIGGNPLIGVGANTSFKGTIYCIRIYDRALTEEEIADNFKVDKQKYGIE